MISVDTKVLAKVIGLKDWPEELSGDRQRMAARCVTDFVRTEEIPDADVSLSNATHWIDRAYDAGQAAGIALERKRWQEKIAKMFDVPVGR